MQKKILVAGGSGFIGINLLKKISLKKRYKISATFFKKKKFQKYKNVDYKKVNLFNLKDCIKITKNIDIVIMCAANTSGAHVIENKPLVHLNPNLRINMNMLEASHLNKVKKFIFISSSVVYPQTKTPLRENHVNYKFYNKYFISGWMKLFSEKLCEIYSNKIKTPMITIIVRPSNLFGAFDKFDEKKSKVIPSLIRRVVKKENPLIVWGNGNDLKDFLFIDDFIGAIERIITSINYHDIFNIGYGKSVTIKKILKLILKIENYKNARILYDKKKPKMVPRRLINTNKSKIKLNFKVKNTIEEGLKKTLHWYKNYDHS